MRCVFSRMFRLAERIYGICSSAVYRMQCIGSNSCIRLRLVFHMTQFFIRHSSVFHTTQVLYGTAHFLLSAVKPPEGSSFNSWVPPPWCAQSVQNFLNLFYQLGRSVWPSQPTWDIFAAKLDSATKCVYTHLRVCIFDLCDHACLTFSTPAAFDVRGKDCHEAPPLIWKKSFLSVNPTEPICPNPHTDGL